MAVSNVSCIRATCSGVAVYVIFSVAADMLFLGRCPLSITGQEPNSLSVIASNFRHLNLVTKRITHEKTWAIRHRNRLLDRHLVMHEPLAIPVDIVYMQAEMLLDRRASEILFAEDMNLVVAGSEPHQSEVLERIWN